MCLTHRDTSKGANITSTCHTLFSGTATSWWQTCCPGPSVLPTDLKADPESVHLKNNVVPKNTTTLYLIQTHYSDWMFKDTWHTPNIHTKYLQTQMHTHAKNQSSRDKRGYICIQTQTYRCINTNTQGPCTITHLCAYLWMCLVFMHFLYACVYYFGVYAYIYVCKYVHTCMLVFVYMCLHGC